MQQEINIKIEKPTKGTELRIQKHTHTHTHSYLMQIYDKGDSAVESEFSMTGSGLTGALYGKTMS